MASPTGGERRASRIASSKRRAGLPDEGSVVSETVFTSPKGGTYRIITTDENDPGEPQEGDSVARRRSKRPPSLKG